MNPLEAARSWVKRGFFPIPVPYRTKKPILDRWQDLRINDEQLGAFFNFAEQNIGILLADNSGAVDIDCDCVEAIAAAAELAPPTGMVFGRKSKPASHYIYRAGQSIPSQKFKDPLNDSVLVELRGGKNNGLIGFQTIVPPSVHATGEEVRFESGFDLAPGQVDPVQLTIAVARIAGVSLLARHWPQEGSRHDGFLALAGTLARADWKMEEAIKLHKALYRIIWGKEANYAASEKEVKSTFENIALNRETTGLPSLSRLVDGKVLTCVTKWLGLANRSVPVHVSDWPEIVPLAPSRVLKNSI